MTIDEHPLRAILPIRAVVDANVFPYTTRWLRPLEDLAHARMVRLFWSPWIAGECHRVLTWLWLRRAGSPYFTAARWDECSAAAKAFASHVALSFRVVEDAPSLEQTWTAGLVDQWDIPVWTAAVRAQAHVVITENVTDGPPPDPHGVRAHDDVCFLHPERFLAFMDWLTEDLGSTLLPRLVDEPVTDFRWWVPVVATTDDRARVRALVQRFAQVSP